MSARSDNGEKAADYGVKRVLLFGNGKNCGRAYNSIFTDGGLVPYLTPENTGLNGVPASVIKGYIGGNGDIFLFADGSLYVCKSGGSGFTAIAENMSETPGFCEYDGGVIISDGASYYIYSDGELTQNQAEYALDSAAYHYFRLFGVSRDDGVTVRWSAAGDISDWTEGLRHSGWLKAEPQKGKIHALIPYNDKLIAVRERGLTQIKAYGATENFCIKNGDTCFEKITENTAAVCADKLLFATYSGVYAYDGDDIEAVCADKTGGLEISAACAAGNVYCVKTAVNEGNILLLIDAQTEDVSFIDLDCDCLFAGGKIYASCGGVLYSLEKSQNVLWDSGFCDLGEPAKKFLKRVYIDCGGSCTLTVTGENGTREFIGVKGRVSVNMAGATFLFKLKADCAVKSFYAEYGLYGG